MFQHGVFEALFGGLLKGGTVPRFQAEIAQSFVQGILSSIPATSARNDLCPNQKWISKS
jgi:hypothetical protein